MCIYIYMHIHNTYVLYVLCVVHRLVHISRARTGPGEAMTLLECRAVHDEFSVRARPDAEQQKKG